jgi:type I restriction enzyme M protein
VALAAVREKLGDEHGITDELLQAYRDEASKAAAQASGWQEALNKAQAEASQLLTALAELNGDSTFAQRKALHAQAEAINPALKAGLAALEARHKAWLKVLDVAEKTLRPRQWAAFDGDAARDAKKALLPRDLKKREKPTVRDQGVEAFKRASYFIAQGHWLLSRFPSGLYEDVLGLCKAVSRAEIQSNDYSLTPGRYVGAAMGVQSDDDGEAFVGRMREIHSELAELDATASLLASKIQTALAEVFE